MPFNITIWDFRSNTPLGKLADTIDIMRTYVSNDNILQSVGKIKIMAKEKECLYRPFKTLIYTSATSPTHPLVCRQSLHADGGNYCEIFEDIILSYGHYGKDYQQVTLLRESKEIKNVFIPAIPMYNTEYIYYDGECYKCKQVIMNTQEIKIVLGESQSLADFESNWFVF